MSWFAPALPLASLLFGLHRFLGDSSTLIAWSWTGYPINGPVPHLHGSLTLLAQAFGLLIAIAIPDSTVLLSHPLWLSIGIAAASVLYHCKDWPGYTGGLCLAIFFMSIIPQTLLLASRSNHPAKTYFCAFLGLILFYLADAWTVAYAFVPGGVYLRERSDL